MAASRHREFPAFADKTFPVAAVATPNRSGAGRMIMLDAVTVRSGAFELRNVGFVFPSGSYVVLMGRTGSGKSTLLEAICGLRPVLDGAIRLGDRDVTRLPAAARDIGYVP
jgi:ABC-type sugar transport system ATPase subunit